MARDIAVSFEDLEKKEQKKQEKKDAPKKYERELVIRRAPNGLYYVEHEPAGGVIPDILKGNFTTKVKVENAIARYLIDRDG